MSEQPEIPHYGAPDQAPELPARTESLGLAEYLVKKLEDMDTRLQISNANLERNLPGAIAHIMRDELKGASIPQEPNYAQINSVQISEAQEKIAQLSNQNETLAKQVEQLQRQVGSLNLDLNKKRDEARKLHEIILQSSQDSPDVSDEEVSKRFGELNYDIQRIINRHFLNLRRFNDLAKDDRIFYLRSKIAQQIYQDLFGPSVKIFGVDLERERHLEALECKLLERKVPRSEVDSWRVKTVKVCAEMELKVPGKRFHRCKRVCDGLYTEYMDCWSSSNRHVANEMYDLCQKAFELALLLRSTNSVFEWGQTVAPSEVPLTDTELIGPYNMKAGGSQAKPVRVMFGPVWKVVDGERILLRKGEILEGGGPEVVFAGRSQTR